MSIKTNYYEWKSDWVCGSASKTYLLTDTTFWTDIFCAIWNLSATPTFPLYWETKTWSCNWLWSWKTVNCSSSREQLVSYQSQTWPDPNCIKSDVKIYTASGFRIWAGCNSTLGSMNSASINLYNASCYDYSWSILWVNFCQNFTSKENRAGITNNTNYRPAANDNIYGKLYRFDIDIQPIAKCNTKNIWWEIVFWWGLDCPCPSGRHLPGSIDFIQLEESFKCSSSSRYNSWGCPNLWWQNHTSYDISYNIIRALWFSLWGYCINWNCYNRWLAWAYWSSFTSWWISLVRFLIIIILRYIAWILFLIIVFLFVA